MSTPTLRLGSNRAFTLVELLVVMGIIAILSAIAVPLIPSLLRANQLDSSVNTLSGILEQARETAISSDSYVWVAFTDPPNNSKVTGIWVATIKSIDGTESPINTTVTPAWSTTGVTIPGANLQLVSRIQNLAGVRIYDSSTALQPTSYTTLTAKAPTVSLATLFEPSGMQWTVTPLQNTTVGAGTYFTHAIEFTPDGEAHQGSSTWYSNIQFGLMPSLGATTNSVFFNVGRLTGKVTVYRL